MKEFDSRKRSKCKKKKKKKINLGVPVLMVCVYFITYYLVSANMCRTITSIITPYRSESAMNESLGDKVVAYIPLDDRPVNIDRVKYLAQSTGYNLVLPDKDLYSTKLDGNGTNKNGTQYGDPYNLAKWLNEMEDAGCDYYVISLDQLFSGGLASSRSLTERDVKNFDYVKKIFERIVSNPTNHVYLYDSIMRLASTVNLDGFNNDDYKKLYNYANVERKELNDSELTIRNIVANYKKDKNGNVIPSYVSAEKLNKYLSARERKLKLFNYYYKVIGNKENVVLFTGIDDSSNKNHNIQNNELKFLNKKINEYGVNTIIRDGIDEIGMVSFTRLVLDQFNTNVKVKVTYFGGSENEIPSCLSSQTVKENYEDLLKSLSIDSVDTNENISVLIFTAPKDKSKLEQYSLDLINTYKNNIENHIPTIIIDSTQYNYGRVFRELLIKNAPLGYLIGYSNWNVFSNSSGIAMSEGLTRYLYLIGDNKSEECDIAFLKLMTFGYAKDMVYREYVYPVLKNVVDSTTVSKYMNMYINPIFDNLKDSNYISNLSTYEENGIGEIAISNYSFPWNRTFELRFDISVSISNEKIIYYPFINDELDSNKNFNPNGYLTRDKIAKWICDANNLTLVSSYTGYYSDVKTTTENWKYIETATKYGYFKGNGNGKFNPGNYITRAEVVTLILRIVDNSDYISIPEKDRINFSDVKQNKWYYKDIMRASELGLVNGCPDGTFKPDNYSTRAEAVVMIERALKLGVNSSKCTSRSRVNPFNDVSTSSWYYEYLRDAYYLHSSAR